MGRRKNSNNEAPGSPPEVAVGSDDTNVLVLASESQESSEELPRYLELECGDDMEIIQNYCWEEVGRFFKGEKEIVCVRLLSLLDKLWSEVNTYDFRI